ncbi:50S ribosomal protein L3 [Pontiella sulfatireligans]|uniref:Large ribosomal subunit protein uL3 n=1 Tax=Pontiella sulfatireligans TaxID=2750658 RepID=A0A6C2UMQ3_9BACT|nr:50S ribosomal protein L3 [Pontiella sulfatireligans]VGO20551.1 50S ribosomal protein L3 [Pontiella sulfatireligans]
MKGLIGKKLGMASIYDEAGTAVPVTVIEAGPCVVVQRKTNDKEGYSAVQLGFEDQKESRLTKASLGHLKKAGVEAKRILKEFRTEDGEEAIVGDVIDASAFAEVNFVDIVATGKGRGFQGVVKRYDFGGGRASHGGGWIRRTGSIGMCEFPGRVFKGKKMPGHMGSKRVTTQNLKVIQVRPEENLILIKGSVPGANGDIVTIREALKKK